MVIAQNSSISLVISHKTKLPIGCCLTNASIWLVPDVQEGVVQRERKLQQGGVPLQHPGPVQQVVANIYTLFYSISIIIYF